MSSSHFTSLMASQNSTVRTQILPFLVVRVLALLMWMSAQFSCFLCIPLCTRYWLFLNCILQMFLKVHSSSGLILQCQTCFHAYGSTRLIDLHREISLALHILTSNWWEQIQINHFMLTCLRLILRSLNFPSIFLQDMVCVMRNFRCLFCWFTNLNF